MTISKLGIYDTPLSDEERKTLIGFLGDIKTRNLLREAADLLAVEVPSRISLSILYFDPKEMGQIKAEIESRFKILSIGIQDQFRAITGLSDPERWTFTVEVSEDSIPRVKLNEWLNTAITTGFSLPVDLAKVSDEEWINYFNRYKASMPEMVKISPEMKILVEFNEKLNEVADDYTCCGGFDIDFTEIINEIVQATKEGKL